MARRLGLGLVLVACLASLPAHADFSQIPVGCSGNAPVGGSATCTAEFTLPHFDGRDSIDYTTLVARFTSLFAGNWRVEGKIEDTRGVAYFAWYCEVGRSVVFGTTTMYLGRSCEGTRKTITNLPKVYYIADVGRAHRMTVTGSAGACLPSSISGCRFEGAVTFLIGS